MRLGGGEIVLKKTSVSTIELFWQELNLSKFDFLAIVPQSTVTVKPVVCAVVHVVYFLARRVAKTRMNMVIG